MMSKALAVASVLSLLALGLLLVGGSAGLVGAHEEARVVPAPVVDLPAGSVTSEVAVLAGGCFWGVQGVYQHTQGVTNAVSGYAGGEAATAEYDLVGTGGTGHAESVQVTFDPRAISYGRLLQIFFSVVHDPTQKDRQGPDVGSQYRSAIFPQNAEQARVAQAYVAQLEKARTFARPLATTIEPGRKFYPAEAYHQDFLTLNPTYPYIVFNDLPKLRALERLFPTVYRAAPALVRNGGGAS